MQLGCRAVLNSDAPSTANASAIAQGVANAGGYILPIVGVLNVDEPAYGPSAFGDLHGADPRDSWDVGVQMMSCFACMFLHNGARVLVVAQPRKVPVSRTGSYAASV